jgi:hypothetical protein
MYLRLRVRVIRVQRADDKALSGLFGHDIHKNFHFRTVFVFRHELYRFRIGVVSFGSLAGSPACDQIRFVFFLCLPAKEGIGRVRNKVEGKGVPFFNGFILGGPGARGTQAVFLDIEGNLGGVGVFDFFVDRFLEIDFGFVVKNITGSNKRQNKGGRKKRKTP